MFFSVKFTIPINSKWNKKQLIYQMTGNKKIRFYRHIPVNRKCEKRAVDIFP